MTREQYDAKMKMVYEQWSRHGVDNENLLIMQGWTKDEYIASLESELESLLKAHGGKMSEIKFETINGQLCRMVEPAPFTLDATLPCMVVMVQKDKYGRIPMPQEIMTIVTGVSKGRVLCDCKVLKSNYWHYSWFEIIGYPVAEGSKEWALYQMMQGKAITFFDQPNRIIRIVNGYIQDSMKDGYWNRRSSNEFLSYAAKDGWTLYEPEQEYKVGDWVEIECKNGSKIWREQCNIICIYNDGDGYGINFHGDHQPVTYDGEPFSLHLMGFVRVIRKLSPSEVIIHIGCLSGTIGKSSEHDRFLVWHSCPKIDFDYSIIKFSALDAPTRELVESLLKAQEEK